MFSKSDLELSDKFKLPFQPYAPKEVHDHYWAEHRKYLRSLSDSDSVKMDYKFLRALLIMASILFIVSLSLFLIYDFQEPLFFCFTIPIISSIVLYEFIKTKNKLKRLLLRVNIDS